MNKFEIKKIDDIISYIPGTEHPLSSDIGIIKGAERTYLFDVGSSLAALDFLYTLPKNTVIILSHFHYDHTRWLTGHCPGEDGMLPQECISSDAVSDRMLPQERISPDAVSDGMLPQELISSDAVSDGSISSGSVSFGSIPYKPIPAETVYTGSHVGHYTPKATLVTGRITIHDGVKLDIIPLRSSHARGSLALMVNDDFLFLGDATYPCLGKEKEPDYYNVQLLKDQIEQLRSLPATRCGLSHDRVFVRPMNVVLRQLEGAYNNRDPRSPYIKLTSPMQ